MHFAGSGGEVLLVESDDAAEALGPALYVEKALCEKINPYQFRSTPLREGRHIVGGHVALFDEFRSTPLREGRPSHDPETSEVIEFRSTPLREGRQ